MKSKLLPLALGLVSLAVIGCSRNEPNTTAANPTPARTTAETLQADVKGAYNATKDSMSNAWDNVTEYTFEKRSDFADRSKALSADLEARVSELQASRASANASASRQAALDEVRDAHSNFNSKVDALGNATSATWTSARAEVVSAWDRTVAALRNAQADAS